MLALRGWRERKQRVCEKVSALSVAERGLWSPLPHVPIMLVGNRFRLLPVQLEYVQGFGAFG